MSAESEHAAQLRDAVGCIERTCDLLRAEDFAHHPVGGLEVVAKARMEAHDALLAALEMLAGLVGEQDATEVDDGLIYALAMAHAAIDKARGGK